LHIFIKMRLGIFHEIENNILFEEIDDIVTKLANPSLREDSPLEEESYLLIRYQKLRNEIKHSKFDLSEIDNHIGNITNNPHSYKLNYCYLIN